MPIRCNGQDAVPVAAWTLTTTRQSGEAELRWERVGGINSEPGRRLGLVPITEGPVNSWMLGHTLFLEIAYRSGGVPGTGIPAPARPGSPGSRQRTPGSGNG
ncbi:hypothetical protein SGRIM128S_03104 [Streptomyces griseomycini]